MARNTGISEHSVDLNPFIQFDKWYSEHLRAENNIPDSVSLGTTSADGQVSVRTVLLKSYDDNGFVFYTNYNSKKGSQLTSNPKAALLFYWAESGRQIRVEGRAEKVFPEESESYFKTRPRESQIAAWASEQSSSIPDRKYLETKYNYYKDLFFSKPVEKPPHWGGFRIVPEWFEFWQNREFRLHDRIIYRMANERWLIERLAP